IAMARPAGEARSRGPCRSVCRSWLLPRTTRLRRAVRDRLMQTACRAASAPDLERGIALRTIFQAPQRHAHVAADRLRDITHPEASGVNVDRNEPGQNLAHLGAGEPDNDVGIALVDHRGTMSDQGL